METISKLLQVAFQKFYLWLKNMGRFLKMLYQWID